MSRFTDYTQKYFRKALFETQPVGKVTNPAESNELRPSHSLRTIRPGVASGGLIGGNLTLISTTLGTPYEIETREKILFLEDVDEEPYSIDRMLTHLRLAGKFDGVAGMIFGECQDCRAKDYKPSTTIPYGLGEVLDNILGNLKVPVLYGLTIGHTDDQLTLPLGVSATLDATNGTLEIREAAVLEQFLRCLCISAQRVLAGVGAFNPGRGRVVGVLRCEQLPGLRQTLIAAG